MGVWPSALRDFCDFRNGLVLFLSLRAGLAEIIQDAKRKMQGSKVEAGAIYDSAARSDVIVILAKDSRQA